MMVMMMCDVYGDDHDDDERDASDGDGHRQVIVVVLMIMEMVGMIVSRVAMNH